MGGVGNHVFELAQALTKLDVNVTIIAPSNVSLTKDINNNLKIIGFTSSVSKKISLYDFSWHLSKELKELSRSGVIDGIQFSNLTGFFSFLNQKKSYIHWTKCHGLYDPYLATLNIDGNLKIKSYIQRLTLSRITSELCYTLSPYIVANSCDTKERLTRLYNINPKKISVIYNGVNHELFNTNINCEFLRRKLRLPKSLILLYAGGFSFLKGILYLLVAYKIVLKTATNTMLMMVGPHDRASRFAVENLVASLGISKNVRVIDYVPHVDLPFYYALSDICLVPSLNEAFGNVALEAISCGKPVIAFNNVGGLSEIIADAGILVENRSAISLAQAIINLITDADFRQELSKKAAKYSYKFSWDITAQKTLDLLGVINTF